MRIKISKSKNSVHYSIIQDVTRNGKRTTKIYENIGNLNSLKQRAGDEDPLSWLKNYVSTLNNKPTTIIIKKYENKIIEMNKQNLFNIGYLFLHSIYYSLKLNKICSYITNQYQFKYDLNSILSNLIYARIIFPSSKLKTLELSKKFFEQPNFEYNHILRALEIISKESDYIQSQLYNNSKKIIKRNNKVLFYDCTNFFFEIDQEDDLRRYGKSKENRPSPIVQMGLFMDGNGIPLTFNITSGNTNEQTTLKPLEEKIIEDFNLAEIVVCTDAGLASTANRKFNNTNLRKFITTQSIKKLKDYLKQEALDLTKGWKLPGSDKTYDISKLRTDENLKEKYKDKIFYKERWINEDNLEQRLIVTYSVKYQEYQTHIRNNQIERAKKIIEQNPKKIGKAKQNDPKRFIQITNTTSNGEIAEETHYNINQDIIDEEAKYDGLYAVCTNLEDDVEEIIKVHFMTCFLALLIFRILEKKLDEKYTVNEIIETIKNMNLLKEEEGFIPVYTRTNITDLLHEKFGFRTDYEIITEQNLKKIIRKNRKE